MCGRYTLTATPQQIALRFGVDPAPVATDLAPRYNIAPSQANPVVINQDGPALALMQWGLIPAWSREPSSRYSTINARIETVAEKPAFRGPLRSRRCLVPATGYYEWQARPGAPARAPKQPYFITLGHDGGPGDLFAFAGLYDIWRAPDGQELATYTILTTAANDLLRPLHERMPVILPREAEAQWLDPAISDPARLLALLQSPPEDRILAYPVSAAVNSPASDSADLLAPVPGIAAIQLRAPQLC
jgi:putative SOS response-associated peptidase YedK